jgi:hypothetical protein
LRGRVLILSIMTMLVTVLGFSSAVHAEALTVDLDCRSLSLRIFCDLKVEGNPTGERPKIYWLEGGPDPSWYQDDPNLSFRCNTGFLGLFREYKVKVRATFVNQGITKEVEKTVNCSEWDGSYDVASIECKPARTYGLPGGNYNICDTLWKKDGTCPSFLLWPVSGSRARQPVVTTNCTEGWSRSHWNCNDPGGPGLSFYTYFVVTDARGTHRTPAVTPCDG